MGQLKAIMRAENNVSAYSQSHLHGPVEPIALQWKIVAFYYSVIFHYLRRMTCNDLTHTIQVLPLCDWLSTMTNFC